MIRIKRIKQPAWTPVERTLRIVEVVCIIFGLVSIFYAATQAGIAFRNLAYTARQLEQSNSLNSANMMFRFEDQLATEKNKGIFRAIVDNKPILIQNGGKYTTEELNDYLGVFNALNNIYEEGLITTTMLYDDFDDYLVKTSTNAEIIAYLKIIREINPEYFGGFTALVESLRPYRQN